MPLPTATLDALAPLNVRLDEPLVRKTWWRVGGPADAYVEARTVADVQQVVRATHGTGVPLFVMGNASNLLVADAGIRGVVLRLKGELARAERVDATTLRVGGGVNLVGLVRKAPREGNTGIEMLAGIPGTLGGAVVMNAGTRLGELSDVLRSVDVVQPDGSLATLDRADLPMVYRHGGLPEGCVVVRADLEVGRRTAEASEALIEEHLAYRADTQPVDVPTCGSTFRNPPGDSAGRLIEAAGLKGHAIGGARVSPKHANFVENTGEATAADIAALIAHIQDVVEARAGVRLQPEVAFAGDWG